MLTECSRWISVSSCISPSDTSCRFLARCCTWNHHHFFSILLTDYSISCELKPERIWGGGGGREKKGKKKSISGLFGKFMWIMSGQWGCYHFILVIYILLYLLVNKSGTSHPTWTFEKDIWVTVGDRAEAYNHLLNSSVFFFSSSWCSGLATGVLYMKKIYTVIDSV